MPKTSIIFIQTDIIVSNTDVLKVINQELSIVEIVMTSRYWHALRIGGYCGRNPIVISRFLSKDVFFVLNLSKLLNNQSSYH